MPATLTPEQKAQQEQAAAAALVQKIDDLGASATKLKSDYETLKGSVDQMKATDEARFKDVDVKKVFALVEEMRQGQQELRNMIRMSKGGIYVPGLGENKEKFSLQKCYVAIATKNWDDASYEERVMKDAREAVKAQTKGAGHIIGVDSQGGFFVPDQVIPDVIGAIYALSVLLSLNGTGRTRVSVLDGLVGIPVTIPKFLGGMIAYWIGEQDKYIESAVKVGNISMSPRKLGILTRITDEMRRFSSYGFELLLRNDMVQAAAALVDYTILYGTGTNNMPRGVFNVAETKKYYAETHSDVAPSGSAVGGELTFDDLDNMKGVVEDQNLPISNSWAWISNPRYFRRLRQTKLTMFSGQTSGQAYLLGRPYLNDTDLADVIGDFGKTTLMPTKNTAGQTLGLTPNTPTDKKYGDVVGGNWNDVIFGRWGGMEIMEDQGIGKGFATDETYIKARMYADVGYRRPESIVVAADAKMRDA